MFKSGWVSVSVPVPYLPTYQQRPKHFSGAILCWNKNQLKKKDTGSVNLAVKKRS